MGSSRNNSFTVIALSLILSVKRRFGAAATECIKGQRGSSQQLIQKLWTEESKSLLCTHEPYLEISDLLCRIFLLSEAACVILHHSASPCTSFWYESVRISSYKINMMTMMNKKFESILVYKLIPGFLLGTLLIYSDLVYSFNLQSNKTKQTLLVFYF